MPSLLGKVPVGRMRPHTSRYALVSTLACNQKPRSGSLALLDSFPKGEAEKPFPPSQEPRGTFPYRDSKGVPPNTKNEPPMSEGKAHKT